VPTERLETELPVHKDNGITCFEKVFGGGCTSSSCQIDNCIVVKQDVRGSLRTSTKIVEEPNTGVIGTR